MMRKITSMQLQNFYINFNERGKPIPDILFGQNFETTRKTVWSGISAEMVANRKFFAVENEFPCCWQPLLTANCPNVMSDNNISLTGDKSVMFDVTLDGYTGIKQQQKQLAFKENTDYCYRIWVKSDDNIKLTFKIALSQNSNIFITDYIITGGEWKPFSGKFRSVQRCENAVLSISAIGEGRLWIGAVSVMPADNFYGMRTDVISVLKTLKPSCLRFPGGCYAEYYHWKDCLAPVDRRPVIVTTGLDFCLSDSYGHDTHEIGINEFIMLCREIGAQPEITVRLSENIPQDAADLVEYCNGNRDSYWGKVRYEQGFDDAFGVKFWYVGNELMAFGRSGMNEAIKAGKATIEFSRAMKAIDPLISIAGSTWLDNNVWNKQFCEIVAGSIEYASYHQYILDIIDEPDNESKMQILLKAPTTILGPKLEQAYQTVVNDGCNGNISICLDEWNYIWNRRGSVAMGLYVAGVLNVLCNKFEQYRIGKACYFHPLNEGAIKIEPLEAELDDAGLVFTVYNNHRGNLITKPCITENDSQLDICASISADNKYGYITIINRDIHYKAAITLDLPQGYNIYSYDCTLLSVEADKTLHKGNFAVSKLVIEQVDHSINFIQPPASVLGINLSFKR